MAVDRTPLDRDFAVDWYANGWIAAWNQNRPELCFEILTEDFVLDSPTTRHTGWKVQGPQAAADYIGYVLGAYPDLQWEVTAPPMFRDDLARAAFSWRLPTPPTSLGVCLPHRVGRAGEAGIRPVKWRRGMGGATPVRLGRPSAER